MCKLRMRLKSTQQFLLKLLFPAPVSCVKILASLFSHVRKSIQTLSSGNQSIFFLLNLSRSQKGILI